MIIANLACLPIQKIEHSELPENIKEIWKDREAFYGKIIEFTDDIQLQPNSIRGMSGGPLVSIEIDKTIPQIEEPFKNGTIFWEDVFINCSASDLRLATVWIQIDDIIYKNNYFWEIPTEDFFYHRCIAFSCKRDR